MGHFWSKNNNRGVYRTIDGGKSWKQVLYVDEMTGANDIVISNSNPNVIYASLRVTMFCCFVSAPGLSADSCVQTPECGLLG